MGTPSHTGKVATNLALSCVHHINRHVTACSLSLTRRSFAKAATGSAPLPMAQHRRSYLQPRPNMGRCRSLRKCTRSRVSLPKHAARDWMPPLTSHRPHLPTAFIMQPARACEGHLRSWLPHMRTGPHRPCVASLFNSDTNMTGGACLLLAALLILSESSFRTALRPRGDCSDASYSPKSPWKRPRPGRAKLALRQLSCEATPLTLVLLSTTAAPSSTDPT